MSYTVSTPLSAPAFRPDVYEFSPADVVPDALIIALSTVAGTVDGDSPSVHVGFVDDDEATFKAEGADLDEAEPDLSEVLVHTAKLTQLVRITNEQFNQDGTPEQLSQSVNRAIIRRADIAFLAEPAPVGPAVAPMPGLLNVANVTVGGEVATDVDVIVDLIAELEDNLATPSAIVVDPLGWAQIQKLKTGEGYNSTLLPAGNADTVRSLFGLPVFVNRAMTDYSGLVIDRNAVVSAVGPVKVATDTSVYFNSDSVALRCTWRFGHAVTRPERLGTLTIVSPGS